MRTLIDIDDELLAKAFEVSEVKTKKALIHEALEEFIKARYREELIERFGKGDLVLTAEELSEIREND
jgi:Arc/MetJ family transcription regulator